MPQRPLWQILAIEENIALNFQRNRGSLLADKRNRGRIWIDGTDYLLVHIGATIGFYFTPTNRLPAGICLCVY